MARQRRPGRSRLILAVLVVASLILITLDFRDTGPVRTLRSAAGTVFSPLQGAGETIAKPFRNTWHGAFDYDHVKDENAKLKAKLDKIKGNQAQIDSLKRQNKELRKAADIKFSPDIPLIGAQVVSGPLNNFDHSIQIGVGSGDGIRVGMTVVTNAGLVGKITRVYGGRSVVQLMTDPAFTFGVRIDSDPVVVAVAHGDGGGKPFSVDGGIPVTQDVPNGTRVETSGIDRSAFPPGVPVGKVKSSKQSQDATEKSLQIEPLADLESLTYVQVMLYDPPS